MGEIRVVLPDKVDRYIDSLVRTGMFSSKAELFRAALMEYLESVSSVAKDYDSKVMFSPEGRIYQIEYAGEASLRGLPVAGLVFKNGIIFAHPEYKYRDENGEIVKYMEHYPKIKRMGEEYLITFSGLAADAIRIIQKIKKKGKNTPETLAEEISMEFWKFTLSSNLRPLGTSMMLGIKKSMKIAVFDPSGTYFYTKFWALGDGYRNLITELNKKYEENLTQKDALNLLRNILKSKNIHWEILSA